MNFNEFLKNNFDNLSTLFEPQDLEKLQNIYITDIKLFKKIQNSLPEKKKLYTKPIIKQKEKSVEKRRKIVRKKGLPLQKIKKKNPDITKKLIQELETKKQKYHKKEIELVPKSVKVYKKKEKYPDNYLIMNDVKVEIERLEKMFEWIKDYDKDKKNTLKERMNTKKKVSEDFLRDIKLLRDKKHREENHENRSYFSESDEFMNKSEKYTLNIESLLTYLLKHSDSEKEFYDHIIKKSSKLFFQLHTKFMKVEVAGIILLEFMHENLEMLYFYFKFHLSNLCKYPAKHYKNLLPIRTFLNNLKDQNRKFIKTKLYHDVIERINYITDVVEFFYEYVNIFRLNEHRGAQVKEIYKNYPLKKNLFSFENKALFEKVSFNFYNQIE